MEVNHFDEITLLVTHYNRSKSLERLLSEIRKSNCSFNEIIVSDDGSQPEHIAYLNDLRKDYHFQLVTVPKNKGLGNNLNKGQDAVKTPFTLYIQEDFIPLDQFSDHLKNGFSLLQDHKDFDVVRFYAYEKYPYLKPYKDGFSEMIFKWWYPGLNKFAYYSDHPHLKRNTFSKRSGRYLEGTSGDKMEFAMMISVLKNKGKFFMYEAHKSVLEQINSNDEPSTMTLTRDKWRNSENFFVVKLRTVYRYFNCYSALFFRKY